MPKSRDPSPASQDGSVGKNKMKDEATPSSARFTLPEESSQTAQTSRLPSTAAPTLLAPAGEISQPNQITRTRSPTRLTSDLQVRARVQEERLDTLQAIVEDLQETLKRDPSEVDCDEPDIVRTTVDEVHSMFQQEHAALSQVWPSAQLDHPYYKDKVASTEARVALTARKLLSQLEKKVKPAVQPTQTTSTSQPPQPSARRTRLPEIALPKFEGDYSKWAEFKAHFASVISERADLTAHDKFLYLKGAVTGSAANLISHLPTTDGALDQAWQLLDSRYDNKRLNVQSHMDRLANLKPMKLRKAASLLKMVNIIQETQQALRSFGLEDVHNCFLLTILVRLLDADTREHWESSLATKKEFPTLEELTTFLLARARTLEQLEQLSTARATQSTPTAPARTTPITQPMHQRSASHRATVHSGTVRPAAPAHASPAGHVRTTQSALYPCALCQKDHFLSSCPVFRSMIPHDRVNVVKAHALCVNCLGHHNLRSCRTTQRCKICDEIHHTLLHGADISRVLVPGHAPAAAAQTKSTPAPAVATQTTSTTSTTTTQ